MWDFFFWAQRCKDASISFLWDTAQDVPARRTELRDLTIGVTGCSRIVGEREP